jgi:ABC-type branched-subunit amino acid transport system substrate-binding protein
MRTTKRRRDAQAALAIVAVSLLGAACAGIQPKNAPAGTSGLGGPQSQTATDPYQGATGFGGFGQFPTGTGTGTGTGSPPPTYMVPVPSGRSGSGATGRPAARPSGSASATNAPRTAAGGTNPAAPSPATPASGTPGVPAPNGGNGGATDVGVTADSIKLGGFYVESGPAGSLGITLLKAVKAVYNEVNAQGGIYGRKIQVVDCDTSFTSGDKPRTCYSKLTQQDKVFAFASAGDGPAMVTASPLICKDQIPAIWMDGLASDEFKCPFIFPTGPPGRSQSHVVADYYVKTKKPQTVGFLIENDDIGNEWAQGARDVFARYGVKVVTEQRYSLGDTNLNAQVINMQAANPDFVFFADEPLGGILFQLQAKSLGYKPPLPAAGVTCNVEIWPREVGDYTKGMICEHPWQLPQSGLPEHANFEQTYKKYWNDWEQRNYYTEIHWVAAKAVVETLKAVGPNLTRARLLDVLRRGALNGFDTGFGVKFKQQSSAGGNIFDTEVAVVEITEPSGKPYYYELRQAPAPDPYFTVG